MTRLNLLLLGTISLLLPGSALAQSTKAAPATEAKADTKTTEPSADEKAIRERSQAFARAFEKGDAKAVADFWTENGEYASEDHDTIHGRTALAEGYTKFFAKRPKLKIESKTDNVRFIGKDTAIEEGTFIVKADGAEAETSRFSTLHVREGGTWRFAMVKEWDEEPAPKTLQDLAWLIGDWASDGPDGSARTSYQWMEGKKFIQAKYSIKTKSKEESDAAGTQIIGVDPATGAIKVWTFDSEGGLGEAQWTWDGSRWVIESVGTTATGGESTALNFLARDGENGFTWRSVRRTADGQEVSDLPSVKVKRVASR